MFILLLLLLIYATFNVQSTKILHFIVPLLLTTTAMNESNNNSTHNINSSSRYKEGNLDIYNYSDSAMYIYMKYHRLDSLPLEGGLELFIKSDKDTFDFNKNKIFMPITLPKYHIKAFDQKQFIIDGDYAHPKLPPNFKELTIFFIKEATMRKYDWAQIHNHQMYEQRVILTKEELRNKDGRYTYIPAKYKESGSRFVLFPLYE